VCQSPLERPQKVHANVVCVLSHVHERQTVELECGAEVDLCSEIQSALSYDFTLVQERHIKYWNRCAWSDCMLLARCASVKTWAFDVLLYLFRQAGVVI
jgi:hypothetical protein